MVYEVFGNCIAILEEYEQREQKTNRLTRSNIAMVDQSHKGEKDVSTYWKIIVLNISKEKKRFDKIIPDDLYTLH